MLDFKAIALKKGLTVDIYGKDYNEVFIDDKILLKYDIVISIGKTINYTIALGIPSFVYDHFGGDGFITTTNFEKSMEFNFSGRYMNKKMTGLEIYDSIVTQYDFIKKEQSKIRKIGKESFCFEERMKQVLEDIYSKEKIDYDDLYKNYSILKRKSSSWLGLVMYVANNKVNKITCAKIYYDYGEGYSEANSQTIDYAIQNNAYEFNFDIPKNVKNIRIDFTDIPFTRINEVKINQKKCNLNFNVNCIKHENSVVSINDDQQFIVDTRMLKSKKNNVKCSMEVLSLLQIGEIFKNVNVME